MEYNSKTLRKMFTITKKETYLLCEYLSRNNHHEYKIFHGGCLNCTSQYVFGLMRCVKCKYFKHDWSLPDLSIKDKIKSIGESNE